MLKKLRSNFRTIGSRSSGRQQQKSHTVMSKYKHGEREERVPAVEWDDEHRRRGAETRLNTSAMGAHESESIYSTQAH